MKMTKKELDVLFEHFKKENKLSEKIVLVSSDVRCGKLVSISKKEKFGAIRDLTSYISYSEMFCFMIGYNAFKNKILK